jgi:hypothetical protein
MIKKENEQKQEGRIINKLRRNNNCQQTTIDSE